MAHTWVTPTLTTQPSARCAMAMCHVPGVGTVLISGTTNPSGGSGVVDGTGGHAAIWVLPDGGSTWATVGSLSTLSGGFGAGMAYDATAGKILWVRGFDGSFTATVYEIDPTTWTISSYTASISDVWGEVVYDGHLGKTLYVGGLEAIGQVAAWNWSTHAWVTSSTASHPANYGLAVAFDAGNNYTLAYDPTARTTWSYDGTNWTQHTTTHHPNGSPSQWRTAAAYNPTRNCVQLLDDDGQVYEWVGGDWVQLTTTNTPGGGAYNTVENFAVVYATGQGLLVWGGINAVTSTLLSVAYVLSGDVTLVSIAVTPTPDTIPVSGTVQLTATGTYSDSSTADVTSTAVWTTSNGTIATVVAGLVTGASIGGPVTITATLSGVSGTAQVTVSAPVPQSITVLPAVAGVLPGMTIQLAAIAHYPDGSTADVTAQVAWATGSGSIATVGASTGLVTGVALGLTPVTATLGVVGSGEVAVVATFTWAMPLPLPDPPAVADAGSDLAPFAVVDRGFPFYHQEQAFLDLAARVLPDWYLDPMKGSTP